MLSRIRGGRHHPTRPGVRSLDSTLSRSFTTVAVVSLLGAAVALSQFGVSVFLLEPQVSRYTEARSATDQLHSGLLDMQQGLYGFLSSGGTGFLDTFVGRGRSEAEHGSGDLSALADRDSSVRDEVLNLVAAQRRWVDGWATPAARPDAPVGQSSSGQSLFASSSFLLVGQSLFAQYLVARDRLTRTLDGAIDRTDRLLSRSFQLAVAVELGLSVVLATLWVRERRHLRRSVVQPVDQLLEAIDGLRRGELATQVAVEGPSEFCRIAEQLTTTAGALAESRRELEAERAASAESERRTFQLLEGLPVGVFVLNGEGHPVYANAMSQELLGGSITEVDPSRLAEAYRAYRVGSDQPYPAGELPLARALRGVESEVGDMEIRQPGRTIRLAVRATPIRDAGGAIQYAVASFTDITAQLESQRLEAEKSALARHTHELERSNRELERFAYVASHDLQEPLRMVTSYVQLLDRRYRGRLDLDADQYIGFAVEGAVRMKALLTDLLAFSRLDTASRGPSLIEVGGCVEGARARLSRVVADSSATVECGDLPEVDADPVQLTQLFEHLIDNAVKFRRDGVPPRIRISVERDGQFWRFTVADNGIGIPPHQTERVFVVFQRLHSREEYGGTGIGLAICKKIVEQHGGRIWIEPGQDGGSAVRFTLPMAGTPAPLAVAAGPNGAAQVGRSAAGVVDPPPAPTQLGGPAQASPGQHHGEGGAQPGGAPGAH